MNTTTTIRTCQTPYGPVTEARVWDVYEQQWQRYRDLAAIPNRVMASLTPDERDLLASRLPYVRLGMECQSGYWDGYGCESLPLTPDRQVRVRYVPDEHRDTATAVGSWRGLARTITVCPECAERMDTHDGAWISILRAPGSWYVAPVDDPGCEYAAGYDGNVFPSEAAARAVIPELARGFGTSPDDWVAIQREAK